MINYIIGFYFLVLPLITSHKSYDNFEYPKVVFFVISMGIILIIKLWQIKDKTKKYFKLNLIDKLLILLLVLQIISWMLNGFLTVTFFGQYYRYQGLITLISYYCFYFFISRFGDEKELHRLISYAAIFYVFYILISGILFNFFHLPIYTFNGRQAGTFGNPNFAAGFLALSFPYLLFQPKIKQLIKFILSLIFLVALLFTQSRSGLLAFSVVLVLFLTKKYKNNLLLIFPTIIISSIILFSLFTRYSPNTSQIRIWQKAVLAINQRPTYGYGLERFEIAFEKTLIRNKDFDFYNVRVDKAHNEILEQGVSGGIITMIVYIGLLIMTLLSLYKHKNKYWLNANYFAMIVFIIISQLNVLNINEYLFFYLILASTYKESLLTS
jgi:O-antigen ligase